MTDNTLNLTTPHQHTAERASSLSLEVVLYAALLAFSLVLHLAALGDVPMALNETRPTLAAWVDVYPQNPIGEIAAPTSAAVYWAQRIGFGLLGGTELAARLVTALLGAGLMLAPLLFRDLLKPHRAFLLGVALTVSPTLFMASRFSGSMTWALLLVILALWALKRWWYSGAPSMATAATAFGVLAVLLTGTAGLLLALVTGAGLALAVAQMRIMQRDDDTPRVTDRLRERAQNGGWWRGLAVGIGLAALIASGFALHLGGFEMIGAGLAAFVAGIAPQATSDHATPLFIALFYEPLLWLFAIAGVVMLTRQSAWSFVDRAALAALGVGLVVTLLYGQPEPQFALLLTMPLAVLASSVFAHLFYDARIPFLPFDELDDADAGHLYTARWGRYLVAIAMGGFMLIFLFHFSTLARAWLSVSASDLAAFFQNMAQNPVLDAQTALVRVVVSLMFVLVGHFLAAGVWGHTTSLQGIGIALFVILLGSQISAGWYAGVVGAGSATEPYHTRATSDEYPLLRRTLLELARREQKGEPLLNVTIVEDRISGLTRDGLLGWAVRDFPNARFVDDIRAAQRDELVIARVNLSPFGVDQEPINPELGAPYVGQSFALSRAWIGAQFQPLDVFSWVLQRRVRVPALVDSLVILWVRQDIFDSQTTP